jgi:signal transduction histidine kinase
MLHEFLLENKKKILAMTEEKTLDLAGDKPSSEKLKQGLPIFYGQLIDVLKQEQSVHTSFTANKAGMAKAARDADEPAMSAASGRPDEVSLAKSAGLHGLELLRLGYTLSHVVHAYGAMCQSITELATQQNSKITTTEFHDLNQCLDVAIAGAVTAFESQRNTEQSSQEVEHLGFLAHELRNALNSVTMAYQLVKDGLVAPGGSTGQVLERGLKRIDELIDRSLTEVRLRVEPKVHAESGRLLQLVDTINGGKIQVRGNLVG